MFPIIIDTPCIETENPYMYVAHFRTDAMLIRCSKSQWRSNNIWDQVHQITNTRNTVRNKQPNTIPATAWPKSEKNCGHDFVCHRWSENSLHIPSRKKYYKFKALKQRVWRYVTNPWGKGHMDSGPQKAFIFGYIDINNIDIRFCGS